MAHLKQTKPEAPAAPVHVDFLPRGRAEDRRVRCNLRKSGAAGGIRFPHRAFDDFTGLARPLLDPAEEFFLLPGDKLQVIIRELGPLLLQLALGELR